MNVNKLRLAIIGAGQVAQTTHIPNLRQMDEVEIAGICDTYEETVRKVAMQFQINRYFTDYKKMLHEIKADAVLICVPNKFHCSITLDVLGAGCHVFCEKPPAITEEEAVRMERMSEEKNLLLTYGFHFRHSSQVLFLKKKIDNGEFGNIYSARVSWLRRRGIPGWGNFINKDMQGGGPLIDIGAHMLDAALYLMEYPEISYVCATENNCLGKSAEAGLMGEWDRTKFTVEDSLFGYIRFKDGSCMELETAFALNQKERDIRNVLLYGEKLGASLFPLEVYGEENGMVTDQFYPYTENTDSHFTCLNNFVRACLKQEPLLITAAQGTYIQKVIAALYHSAKTGEPVMMQ